MSSDVRIRSSARGESTLVLHGQIGDGITARSILDALAQIPKTDRIRMTVNSGGGDAFEGLALYNILVRVKDRLVAEVAGLAASAASLIVMAAGKIEMPSSAYLMIHNPWSTTTGDAEHLVKHAKLLGDLGETYSKIYSDRTGRPVGTVKAMMSTETWMSGKDAQAAGFCDAVLDSEPVMASAIRAGCLNYKNLPKSLRVPAQADVADLAAAYWRNR
jgi:ATP-dependent protease ClpP protease subunit